MGKASRNATVDSARGEGASTTVTHYFGVSPAGVNFEFVDGSSEDTWNDYLYAGGEMVGVQKRVDGGAVLSTRYFVKDHLGSIAVLTTETGAVAKRLAYDAWDKRRHPDGSDDPAGAIVSETTRGRLLRVRRLHGDRRPHGDLDVVQQRRLDLEPRRERIPRPPGRRIVG